MFKKLQKHEFFKKNLELKKKDYDCWTDQATGRLKEELAVKENCYACLSSDARVWGRDGPFTILECNSCGHKYISPRLNDMEQDLVYNRKDGRWQINILEYYEPTLDFRMKELYPKRVDLMKRLVGSEGKVLDFGCNLGGFLKVAHEANWDVWGIEINEKAAEKAAKRLGLPEKIFNGKMEDTPYPDESFDVITLWDVLEHLSNPDTVLEFCHKKLKTGGFLILDVPHADSFEFRILGECAVAVSGDVHLSYFAKASLEKLAVRNSFHVKEITTFGLDIQHIMREDQLKNDEGSGRLLRDLADELQLIIDNSGQGCYLRAILLKK